MILLLYSEIIGSTLAEWAAEKVGYSLRKPLVAHDHEWEGPAPQGVGGAERSGGFPEGVPYFFSGPFMGVGMSFFQL